MIRAFRFNERDGARQHGAVAGAYAADQRRDVGRGEGGGTGFLIDKDGTIATNHHVIENATRVRAPSRVTLP